MKFAKDKNYKLIEFGDGLIITEVQHNLSDKNAKPLIVADAGRLLTYLDRFFYEREDGKSLKDAHDLAMNTAQITAIQVPG